MGGCSIDSIGDTILNCIIKISCVLSIYIVYNIHYQFLVPCLFQYTVSSVELSLSNKIDV